MNNDDLIKIWENNSQDSSNINHKISKEMIENYLKPKISNLYLSFNISIVVTLAAFIAGIVVFSINTYIYRGNPAMFKLELGFLLLSMLFFIYGIFIFMKLREINNFSKSLIELIGSKIKFIKSHYEAWLVVLSVGMMILVFGVNTLADNQNGTYKINDVTSYVFVNLFVFGFVYLINKISAYTSIQKMKLYLSDLQLGAIENSKNDEIVNKKRTWIFICVAVIVTVVIVLGILKLVRFF